MQLVLTLTLGAVGVGGRVGGVGRGWVGGGGVGSEENE